MMYRSETKLQGWRALAIFENGSECLIYLGRSTTQIRTGYVAAFNDILDEDERTQVKRVSLQCWEGAADEGRWVQKNTLAIPGRRPMPNSAEEQDPDILAFPGKVAATA